MGRGRARLGEPVGELLLHRALAARAGADDARGRRGRLPGAVLRRGGRMRGGQGAACYVLLEDGTRFDGEACGADAAAPGEVVFAPGMSGYQQCMAGSSFPGELITYTYPHIGNYGVGAAAMESERAWARAAIMRAATN